MRPKQPPRASKSWAYAYQLNPPQPEPRFAKVRMLLRRARLAAQRDGRLWTGQIVMESHITHILVVTDAPDEVHTVDRAIDAELKRLKMGLRSRGPRGCCCRASRPADALRKDPLAQAPVRASPDRRPRLAASLRREWAIASRLCSVSFSRMFRTWDFTVSPATPSR